MATVIIANIFIQLKVNMKNKIILSQLVFSLGGDPWGMNTIFVSDTYCHLL